MITRLLRHRLAWLLRRVAQRARRRLAVVQPHPRPEPIVQAGFKPAVQEVNSKASIIVVTYNNLALTRQCLESVLTNTGAPNCELVVVDNGSDDGTPGYLQQLAAANPACVKVRLNDTNKGFASATNQGLALASGEIIVFLNNDTVVPRGWLAGLAHYLRNPQVGLVGPVTNGAGNEARIEPGYGTLADLQAFADRRAHERAGLAFDIPVLALYCAAARREVLDRVGPLDERFGQGLFEDDDLALRVRRAGYRVLCAEDVYVHHWQRAAFERLDPAEYDTLFAKNRTLFETKWRQRWQPHKSRQSWGGAVRPTAFDPHLIVWQCNICGQASQTRLAELTREAVTCVSCRSTVRWRAMIHLLSTELFGVSRLLQDFPARRDLRGLGLSDWEGYAEPLARKFDYTNTYFHQKPRLDITDIDPALEGTLDFLIASEVFEHVAPPVARAFVNARRLLKPDGVIIFSVPYTLSGATVEHFPDLHEYKLRREPRRATLHNITRDGHEQRFTELNFHGGPGATLEMRVFSRPGLQASLVEAGFSQVQFHGESHFAYGVFWDRPWSLPLTARPA